MDAFFAKAHVHPLFQILVIFASSFLSAMVQDMQIIRPRVAFGMVWLMGVCGFFSSVFFAEMNNLGLMATEFAFMFTIVYLVSILFHR